MGLEQCYREMRHEERLTGFERVPRSNLLKLPRQYQKKQRDGEGGSLYFWD